MYKIHSILFIKCTSSKQHAISCTVQLMQPLIYSAQEQQNPFYVFRTLAPLLFLCFLQIITEQRLWQTCKYQINAVYLFSKLDLMSAISLRNLNDKFWCVQWQNFWMARTPTVQHKKASELWIRARKKNGWTNASRNKNCTRFMLQLGFLLNLCAGTR